MLKDKDGVRRGPGRHDLIGVEGDQRQGAELATFVLEAVSRTVGRLVDRAWFGPVGCGTCSAGRFMALKLIYQPFVRPLGYLR